VPRVVDKWHDGVKICRLPEEIGNGDKKRRHNHPLDNGFAIYLRTSDAEAQAPEKSQAGQRRVIEERIIATSEVPILEIYADAYTGTSADRQDYQRMWQLRH
jgi:hypothetical protein